MGLIKICFKATLKDAKINIGGKKYLQTGIIKNVNATNTQLIDPKLNKKRGGYRANSGRKKSDIETVTLSFRVPECFSIELKELMKTTIAKFLVEAGKKRGQKNKKQSK